MEIVENSRESRDGIYLFISFDLVNATEYKIRNHSWHKTFQNFYQEITERTCSKDGPLGNSKVWKFIGDEVLFYLKVTNKNELFQSLPYLSKVVTQIENKLEKKSDYYDKLFIKTTLWIADVTDEKNLNYKTSISNIKATNVIFTPPCGHNSNLFINHPDFIGFEIDLGFRISKYAHKNVIVVDAKLSYLLYKHRDLLKDTNQNLRIIRFEILKGIWRNHKYPIIWYSKIWDNKSLFLYDEHFKNNDIKMIKKKIKKKKLQKLKKLKKIFEDINQLNDIDEITKRIIK